MSVCPEDVLASARNIRDHQANEAGHRAVISRAYYAAYHSARAFHAGLPNPDSVKNATGLHEQLAEQLKNPGIPTTNPNHLKSRRVGIYLRDLHRSRVLADYKFDDTVPFVDAEQAISVSTTILNLAG